MTPDQARMLLGSDAMRIAGDLAGTHPRGIGDVTTTLQEAARRRRIVRVTILGLLVWIGSEMLG